MGLYLDDTLNGIIANGLTADDSVSVSESIDMTIQFDEIKKDEIDVKERIDFHVNESVSDNNILFSDSVSTHVVENPTDPVNFTEIVSTHVNERFDLVIRLGESFDFLENVYRDVQGERFLLTDSVDIDINDVYQDTQPIAEVISFNANEIHDDTMPVSDNSTIHVMENHNEPVSLMELVQMKINKPRPIATAGPISKFVLG